MADLLQLLKDYGFSASGPDGKVFSRDNKPNSDVWVRREDGWLCYQQISNSFGGGEPWGLVDDTFPKRMLVPYTQKKEFAGVSGLHPANPDHAQFFEWIWPDSRLEEIFSHAMNTVPEGMAWRKKTNEAGEATGYELVPAES